MIPPSAWDLEQTRRLAVSEEASLRAAGIERFLLDLSGEELIRRYIFEPSLNIAGLWGG